MKEIKRWSNFLRAAMEHPLLESWNHSRLSLTGCWITSPTALPSEGYTRWSPGILFDMGFPMI